MNIVTPSIEALALELLDLRRVKGNQEDAARQMEIEATLRCYVSGTPTLHHKDEEIVELVRGFAVSEAKAADQFDYPPANHPLNQPLDDEQYDTLWDNLVESLLDGWYADTPDATVEVRRYLQAATVVSIAPLPQPIKRLIEEVRRCFASGFYQAAVSLCRTILEKAVTDLAAGKGLIPKPTGTKDYFKEYPPYSRFERLLATDPDTLQDARDLYNDCSAVIHGQRSLGERRALEIVRSTSFTLGVIFSKHHIQDK